MENYKVKYPQEENFSFKQLYAERKGDILYLWKKKWSIIAIGFIGGALGCWYALTSPVSYTAKLTFVVEDAKSSGGSLASTLAGQFGFDLNGIGGASGILAGDNIEQLLKSNTIIRKALLTPYGNTENHTLADIYAIKNKLIQQWEIKYVKDGSKLSFPLKTTKPYTRLQDSLLQDMVDRIVSKELGVAKPDKKTSFFEVTTSMRDEKLAQLLCKEVLNQGSDFYIQTKTKRLRTNVDRLQIRADSLTKLLNRKTYSASSATQILLDINPAYTTANVGSELKERDKMVLSTIYSEVVKNLEVNKALLMQETPTVQIVDEPNLPLIKNKLKWWKGVAYAVFFVTLFYITILLFIKPVKTVSNTQ